MSSTERPLQDDTLSPPLNDKYTPEALKPITSQQRIGALDILRGFALIGILLMNIEWFGRPISSLGMFDPQLSGLDHAVGWLIRCFVEGKFYKLFALLFGMGFAVMLTQALQKERPFVAWFTRRMLVLYVLGILHMAFLWQGDILHDYALSGLLMLGFIHLLSKKRFEKYNNPHSILKIALWWLSIPMLLASFAGIGFSVFSDRQTLTEQWHENQEITRLVTQLKDEEKQNKQSTASLDVQTNEELDTSATESAVEDAGQISAVPTEQNSAQSEALDDAEPTLEEQAQEIFAAEQKQVQDNLDEIAALSQGNYWKATAFRIKAALLWLLFSPLFALTLLVPLFLLGYWLVITGAIKDHAQHPKLFSYMARIGLGVGLITTVAGLIIMGHPEVEHIMSLQGVAGILFNVGQFFMAAGYLGVLVRLLDSPKWHKRLAKLAPMGRMALTNYIMHSVILTSIFYGYAGGFYGEISRAPQMLIVLAIVLVQIPLSTWWLSHYQFGPLEWLWRSLSYKKWQNFKVSTN